MWFVSHSVHHHLEEFQAIFLMSKGTVSRPELRLWVQGRLDYSEHPLRIFVPMHPGFNEADFQMGPGSAWKIILEYEDVFGQQFHTTHQKNPQQP